MKPAVAALLFHAPGVRFFTGRRLTPLGFKVNAAALSVTGAAMVLAGLERGPWGVLLAWAVGHTVWSITFATTVQRLTRADGRDATPG